jgi:hypothetical protein
VNGPRGQSLYAHVDVVHNVCRQATAVEAAVPSIKAMAKIVGEDEAQNGASVGILQPDSLGYRHSLRHS